MLRAEKAAVVEDLHGLFEKAQVVVVAEYRGLSVPEVTELRTRMREAGAGFKVTKNRLTKRALEGTGFAAMAPLFKGPTAIAYSSDPVAAAKAATEFAKKNDKLKITGGGIAGSLLSAEQVKALAELPSLDQLRARIVGLLNAPAARLVGVLQAPAGQLARVLKARAEQGAAD